MFAELKPRKRALTAIINNPKYFGQHASQWASDQLQRIEILGTLSAIE